MNDITAEYVRPRGRGVTRSEGGWVLLDVDGRRISPQSQRWQTQEAAEAEIPAYAASAARKAAQAAAAPTVMAEPAYRTSQTGWSDAAKRREGKPVDLGYIGAPGLGFALPTPTKGGGCYFCGVVGCTDC
ncbi:hypothetical protein CFN78_06795 [Amycolatopsis antarctica]|uniref:Uncharacterized protein n=1 Tax=Amycolatopsis antarctica TaxID=1854586 RepID=A0A263D6A0_9PSEU|nr:hypothetical protein [Amycolatopsis antarctica]OZM73990.1 hypothetical protein CFN78_06795 [Amycolatopsis antarctica]